MSAFLWCFGLSHAVNLYKKGHMQRMSALLETTINSTNLAGKFSDEDMLIIWNYSLTTGF